MFVKYSCVCISFTITSLTLRFHHRLYRFHHRLYRFHHRLWKIPSSSPYFTKSIPSSSLRAFFKCGLWSIRTCNRHQTWSTHKNMFGSDTDNVILHNIRWTLNYPQILTWSEAAWSAIFGEGRWWNISSSSLFLPCVIDNPKDFPVMLHLHGQDFCHAYPRQGTKPLARPTA